MMTDTQRSVSEATKVDEEHPYLGLQPFAEKDSSFFFGRLSESDKLLRCVERDVLTVVFGVSGLGKTSLLNAGLFPLLRQAQYLPVSIRLAFGEATPDFKKQTMVRISEVIDDHCPNVPKPAADQTLWEYFHRVGFRDSKDQMLTPILVFDQFEEIFTHGKDDKRLVDFLEVLADVVENHIPRKVRKHLEQTGEPLPFDYRVAKIKVILCLREDYLPQLEDLRPKLPSLAHNRFHLTPMNGEQGLEAVLKPGRHLVSEQVAEQIVRYVAGESKHVRDELTEPKKLVNLEVEPALLSLVCDQLNKSRLKQQLKEITSQLLHGEREHILFDFYENCFEGVSSAARVFLEDELLTVGGHRCAKALEDALQTPGIREEDLTLLVKRRLLRREFRFGTVHLELMHDVLREVVENSRDARHEEEQREKAERIAQDQLRQLERAVKDRHQRQRMWTAISVLAIIVAIMAFWGWLIAANKLGQIRALESASYSKLILDEKPDQIVQSVLFAAESLRLGPTLQAYQVWSKAMNLLPTRISHHPLAEVAVSSFFSATGERLALIESSVDEKKPTLGIFDVTRGSFNPVCSSEIRGDVAYAAFNTRGTKFALATREFDKSFIYLYDFSSYTTQGDKMHCLKPVTIAPLEVKGLAFVDHRELLLIAYFEEVTDFKKLKGKDLTDKFKERSSHLLSGPRKVKLHIQEFDTATGTKLASHSFGVTQPLIAISANGHRLVSTERKQNNGSTIVKLWALKGKQPKKTMQTFYYNGTVKSMFLSADGNRLALYIEEAGTSIVTVRDLNTGQELLKLEPLMEPQYLVFSPNGDQLAAKYTNSVQIWSVQDGFELSRMTHDDGPDDEIVGMGFNAKGTGFVTVSSNRVWHWDSSHITHRKIWRNPKQPIQVLAFSSDGSRLAMASENNLQVWSFKTNTTQFDASFEKAMNVAFHPEQELLAAAGGSTVNVFDVNTGNQLATINLRDFDGRSTDVNGDTEQSSSQRKWSSPVPRQTVALAFTAGRNQLVITEVNGNVWNWQWKNKLEKSKIVHRKPDDQPYAVALSQDANHVVVVQESDKLYKKSYKKECIVFVKGIADTMQVKKLRQPCPVTKAAFNRNGDLLATASEKIVRVWDLRDANKDPLVSLPHNSTVTGLAFSSDGDYLATVEEDSNKQGSIVGVWDLNKKKQLFRMPHESRVLSIAFRGDSTYLATASSDGTTQIWPLFDTMKSMEAMTALTCDDVPRAMNSEELRQIHGKITWTTKLEATMQRLHRVTDLGKQIDLVWNLISGKDVIVPICSDLLAGDDVVHTAEEIVELLNQPSSITVAGRDIENARP